MIDVTDAENIVGTSKPVQDAYAALRAASGRYSAIRTAQRHVYAISGAPQSGDHLFTEIENVRELWGDSWRGRRQTMWRPDPEHPLRRLIWLATSDARPWMPTANEADAVATRGQGRVRATQPRERARRPLAWLEQASSPVSVPGELRRGRPCLPTRPSPHTQPARSYPRPTVSSKART